MQHAVSITADAPASHLTIGQVLQLATDSGAQPFQIGLSTISIRRGSFWREFKATSDGLFRAAPIRTWLGA